MTDGTVTPIRRDQPPYTDTAALNDIHVLLTAAIPGTRRWPTSRPSWPALAVR